MIDVSTENLQNDTYQCQTQEGLNDLGQEFREVVRQTNVCVLLN